jgi:hypothetical protein
MEGTRGRRSIDIARQTPTMGRADILTGMHARRRPRADGQPPVSAQRADVGRPEGSAFHHSSLGRSGVGTVAWGQSPVPDQRHLYMCSSVGGWRGRIHLLSAAEGDADRVDRPSGGVSVRHRRMFQRSRALNGDDCTGPGGLTSRARCHECTGADRHVRQAGRRVRRRLGVIDSCGGNYQRGDQVYGVRYFPAPEQRSSVSSWVEPWTAIGRGAQAEQAGRELDRD